MDTSLYFASVDTIRVEHVEMCPTMRERNGLPINRFISVKYKHNSIFAPFEWHVFEISLEKAHTKVPLALFFSPPQQQHVITSSAIDKTGLLSQSRCLKGSKHVKSPCCAFISPHCATVCVTLIIYL